MQQVDGNKENPIDQPNLESDRLNDVSAPFSSSSGLVNIDKILSTLNALAIIFGGLWALYEWHDFRKENGQLTLEQQRQSLTQTQLQIKGQELQSEQTKFAISQQGLAKVQQELAVKQQMLQLEQERFAIQQQGITKEQQQLAVEMAKASLSFQKLQNESALEKNNQKRFETSTGLKIVRLSSTENTKQEKQLYKVWFQFEVKNISDKPFTLCYTITDIFIASQSDLIGSETLATHVPFPPSVADNVYNRDIKSPWKKITGEAYQYQGGSSDCGRENFMFELAGYNHPIQGGGGTNIIQPGGTSMNSPVFIVRAKPTDWVALSTTFGIGSRYEFFNRLEPLEPGVGEKPIERWQDSGEK